MVDISTFSDEAWQEAKRRADVIRPLANRIRCRRALVRAAAQDLGLSERQVYTLVRRFRDSDGRLDALIPAVSSGGRGSTRINNGQEELIHELIYDVYLSSQRPSAEAFLREVRRHCLQAGLKPPSASTVRRRLKTLSLEERRRRGDAPAPITPVAGRTPIPLFPLDAVQIDHTPVDIILVDPIDRQPIGRPWVTVAIDIYSRCIAGIHLSLEAPSATSVGLCLVHVGADKSNWLAERGIEAEWLVSGKPRLVSVDNGAEFHSAAFERGCEQHGIAIYWRPPGQPHFGGIVERVIGTLMKLVHELPGSTFSNPTERQGYDSDANACLTMEELIRWLTVAITGYYHNRPHSGIAGETPIKRYRAGIAERAASGETLPVVGNARAFLIDFLPVVRRTLQRNGVTIDHITYYSPALSPRIVRHEEKERLLIRRDPRDISRIYVFDADMKGYLEVPYRDLSRPAISLWEHRLALHRLREQRRQEVDEKAIFEAVAEMRAIEREAVASTRTARRNRTRRLSDAPPSAALPSIPPGETPVAIPADTVLPPFDEIDGW